MQWFSRQLYTLNMLKRVPLRGFGLGISSPYLEFISAPFSRRERITPRGVCNEITVRGDY